MAFFQENTVSESTFNSSQSFVDRFNNLNLVKKLTVGFSVSIVLIVLIVLANYVFVSS